AAARSPTSPPPLRGTTQGPLISALRRYQSTLMSPQRRDQRGSGAARPPGGRGGRLGSPCPSPPLLRPGRNGRGTVHGPSPPAHARPEQDGHRAAHRPPPPIPAQPPPAATAALGPGSLPLPHAGRPSAYPTTSQREPLRWATAIRMSSGIRPQASVSRSASAPRAPPDSRQARSTA